MSTVLRVIRKMMDKECRQTYDTGMAKRLDLVKVASARDACRNGAARALRLSAGLSLREIAEEVGAGDPSTVLRWEKGQRRPRGEMAERYGDLLDRLASRGRR